MRLSKDKWVTDNYDNYWSMLLHYASNITRDQQVAQDIVQEVFVYVWTNYDSLDITNAKAYLIRSVKNKSIAYLNEVNFNTVQLEEAYFALTQSDTLTREQEQIYHQRLVKQIDITAKEVLPVRCYEVFQLRFYQRLSYSEISKKLGISESTVDNQVGKALKNIKVHLPYSLDYIMVLSYLLYVK